MLLDVVSPQNLTYHNLTVILAYTYNFVHLQYNIQYYTNNEGTYKFMKEAFQDPNQSCLTIVNANGFVGHLRSPAKE